MFLLTLGTVRYHMEIQQQLSPNYPQSNADVLLSICRGTAEQHFTWLNCSSFVRSTSEKDLWLFI